MEAFQKTPDSSLKGKRGHTLSSVFLVDRVSVLLLMCVYLC